MTLMDYLLKTKRNNSKVIGKNKKSLWVNSEFFRKWNRIKIYKSIIDQCLNIYLKTTNQENISLLAILVEMKILLLNFYLELPFVCFFYSYLLVLLSHLINLDHKKSSCQFKIWMNIPRYNSLKTFLITFLGICLFNKKRKHEGKCFYLLYRKEFKDFLLL